MNCLFNNKLKKPAKKVLILSGIAVALVLILANSQFHLLGVSAQIIPVTVSTDHLSFGTVFPGEELQGNFIVTYVDEEEQGIAYRLIQKRKPLPEGHPDYPDGGDPEMPGYYLDLCPFLTKVSTEGESDTENNAFVGPLPDDPSDTWIIYFKVPAIFGHVAQDHTGGVVSESGEYGCDISIDIDIASICDPNQELVENGSFEMPAVTTTQKWDIFQSGTSNLGWTVEWRSDIPTSWGGYSRPSPALQELHAGVNGWLAQEGSQYAELDADWDGPTGSLNNEPASVKIYQDIPTVPGFTYNISFYFSPRPNTTAANNVLEFSWDNDIKDTFTLAGVSNTNWFVHNYSFTASGNTTRLQFTDQGTADSLGTFLDNVSVRCAVPEQ